MPCGSIGRRASRTTASAMRAASSGDALRRTSARVSGAWECRASRVRSSAVLSMTGRGRRARGIVLRPAGATGVAGASIGASTIGAGAGKGGGGGAEHPASTSAPHTAAIARSRR